MEFDLSKTVAKLNGMRNLTAQAEVIEDSIADNGVRLTTLQLMYPRLIHSEFMTHRIFSRNASSSRAIPVAKMIDQVRNNPAMPAHWGKNQAGMQADAELPGHAKEWSKALWLKAANQAADTAEEMMRLGLHKQVANRILEPFQYIHVVVSATDFDGFFSLRDHPDADPTIQELARSMKEALTGSAASFIQQCGWHLPYVSMEERERYSGRPDLLCKISSARCCRVSYLKHDGSNPSVADDLELCDKLAGSVPIHASPFEHVATPSFKGFPGSGNFRSWVQYRTVIENGLYQSGQENHDSLAAH